MKQKYITYITIIYIILFKKKESYTMKKKSFINHIIDFIKDNWPILLMILLIFLMIYFAKP